MPEKKKGGTSLLYSLMAEAAGYDDTIVMGRGDPDFDTPAHIIAAAKEAMVQHHSDSAPPEGLLSLRQAIAERVERVNGVSYDPETEVVVTNGGQEALFLMVLAIVSPGDELIVPEPNYSTYLDSLSFAGGRKVEVSTSPLEDFRADPAAVRAAVSERTRALLLVSPNNPAANVISPADMQAMMQIACDHDLFVIADDIYDLFVYDDFVHTSAASLPGGRERTLTLNALSKAYSMTGWRLGWITGPADLMARVRELKAAITGATSIISQHAGIAALTGPQDAVQMMADAYSRRRRHHAGRAGRDGPRLRRAAGRPVRLRRHRLHRNGQLQLRQTGAQRAARAGLSRRGLLRGEQALHPHDLPAAGRKVARRDGTHEDRPARDCSRGPQQPRAGFVGRLTGQPIHGLRNPQSRSGQPLFSGDPAGLHDGLHGGPGRQRGRGRHRQ